jgi:hypothetical protein
MLTRNCANDSVDYRRCQRDVKTRTQDVAVNNCITTRACDLGASWPFSSLSIDLQFLSRRSVVTFLSFVQRFVTDASQRLDSAAIRIS